MHYNYGWADGYHMDLEYWEIWNEPESKAMWLGTWEEFCEFYSVVANYLKKCFPNLKIGGYSATGFYSVFREKMDAGWFKIAVPYCKQFLEYVTAETTKAPLDFFSWHCYALNPKELENFAYYARETLDSYGLTKTESFLTEYNMFECFTRRPSVTETHASEIVAGIVLGQNAPVDSIMYYDVRTSIYNGIFALKEDCINVKRYQLFYGFKWFNELYKLKGQCFAKSENEKVYVLSATDEKQKKVLVSVTDFDGDLSFNFDECKGNKIVVRCSTFRKSTPTRKIYDFTKNFVLTVKKNNLYLIEIK